MNELVCEMCGSNDIVKQDGLYVCQSCGTKYSVEEARKMMSGETVEVEGTVKIDSSTELANLYEIARRAKDSDNSENAINYYDKILVKDPSSWEAQFYVVYYRASSCKIMEIQSAAISFLNTLIPVLDLVEKNVSSDEIDDVINEISARSSFIADLFKQASYNTYIDVDYQFRDQYAQEYIDRTIAAADIPYTLGDQLETRFNGKYSETSVNLWKQGIEIHKPIIYHIREKEQHKNLIREYGQKIKKYDSEYEIPFEPKPQPPVQSTETQPTEETKKSGGCYVATSIYGSYNCPEVWTLRRFRDNTLDKNIFGRLFIKTYYATSPTVVKYFGDKKIFNVIFKPILDRFVRKLNEKGVESTFYLGK